MKALRKFTYLLKGLALMFLAQEGSAVTTLIDEHHPESRKEKT